MAATEIIVAPSTIQLRPLKQHAALMSPEAEVPASLDDPTPPVDAQTQVERWNHPRSNIFKMAFAFLSFFVAGMNDAAIGVSSSDPACC